MLKGVAAYMQIGGGGPQINPNDRQVNSRANYQGSAETNTISQAEFEQDLAGAIEQAESTEAIDDDFVIMGQSKGVQVRMNLEDAKALLKDLRESSLLNEDNQHEGVQLDETLNLQNIFTMVTDQDNNRVIGEGGGHQQNNVVYVEYEENQDKRLGKGELTGNSFSVTAGVHGQQRVNTQTHDRSEASGVNYQSSDVQLHGDNPIQISFENGRSYADVNLTVDGEPVNYQIVTRDPTQPFSPDNTQIYVAVGNDVYPVVGAEDRAGILAQVGQFRDQFSTDHTEARIPGIQPLGQMPQEIRELLANGNFDEVSLQPSSNMDSRITTYGTSSVMKIGEQTAVYELGGSGSHVNLTVSTHDGEIPTAYLTVGEQMFEIPQDILIDDHRTGATDGVIGLSNEGMITDIHLGPLFHWLESQD